jgi:hypothetical protein
MKLGVSIVFGIVLILIFYCLIAFCVLADISWGRGKLWMAFLLTLPVVLYLGSILAGYLIHPRIDFKWKLIYFSPGLYIAGLCIVISLFTNLQIFFYALILGFYLYLTSLAGTVSGYFIRSRIRGRNSLTRTDSK